MNEWKFKVGDLVEDKFNEYVIAEIDQVKNGYWISFGGKVYFISKDLMETECELVKPKTLFEQALALIGLEVGDRFAFEGVPFEVRNDGIFMVATGWNEMVNEVLAQLLLNKDLIVKTKHKSEAELILDELEKVVDKANEVLRKSGR